jgi:phosphoserine phosphatase
VPVSETCVWFLRHGESTFNLEQSCQGCCDDPELTTWGRKAARLSGERLASEGIQVVISSPLRRAADTAEELVKAVRAQGPAVAFQTDDRLREIELYRWEGLHLEEIPRRFPEEYGDWRFRPDEFHMRSSDNEIHYPVRSLFDRARSFCNDLLTSHAGKSILLVAHGGTIRALIASALGLGTPHFHTFQQSNCGLSRVRVAPDSARATLDLLNDTTHLGERLPKLKEGRRGLRLLLVPVEDRGSAAIRRLASSLKGLAIDYLFVAAATARSVANQFLSSRSDSWRMVSNVSDANAVVERALLAGCPGQLCSLAILGPQLTLQRVLQQQLCLSAGAAGSLDLRPFEITPVHCPGNGTPPVLQAVNTLKVIPSLVEVQT